ncbi:MAG: hypothetical protein A3B47_00460 [Candidatus Levybacteria bacterium RIFCSPLOWO2_01_FULL_39_24]|nr:MAG: hypothetical protein A2800_00730 [Candidatus Levybacteria bacterium RIFCSPHIGHO2_01_FULL_40_16]OGH46248.1 MAG: hypothetical protein A3B47_00460 [Candidatus Levybacteria bacterium RIFCSPLOWO2_01_FULL_39_24]
MGRFIKKELLILYLIIFVGLFLRVQGIFTNSFAFTYDVGRDMLAVSDIVHLGKILLIGQTTGLPGLFYGPWWYYILIPPFVLASGDPAGVALFIALSGAVTVLLGFKLGKGIGGTVLGLVFASFLSFSPVMVGLTSQIWNPNLIPLFIIIFMYCLHRIFVFLEKKKGIGVAYLLFLGLLLGLILDLEVVFGLLFLVGAIISIILFLGKRIKLKDYLFIILGFFIIMFPRIVFELRHNFLMTNALMSFVGNTLSSSNGSQSSFAPVNSFIRLYGLWTDTISMGNVFWGFVLLFLLAFGLISLHKKMEKEKKFFLLINLIILTTFLIGLSFFPGAIWSHYIVGIPVLYIFILSIAVSKLLHLKKTRFIIVLAFVILLASYVNPIRIISEYQKPLWEGDASVYRNQLVIVDYIYKEAQGKEFKYVVYTPPVHDYTYKYLFKWYGLNKYNYLPSSNSRLAYFILEPDLQYPSRLTDWLRLREKDGRIIKAEKFKSGIIVQTRIH